ncbi:MAG: hypothetical protein PHG00_00335 [Methylococcales bacterium]|nr:hypothetical protein [Methylococcales bacterium]
MPPTKLKMSPTMPRIMHWIGSVLAVAGVLFVGLRLHSYGLDLDFSSIKLLDWGLISLLAVIYGAANFFLALAWWHLLRHFNAFVTRSSSIKIYGTSQLAKYVPGNIFHLAGRQALGMSSGIPSGALAKSMLWELGLIVVAGALFGWLVLPRLLPQFPLAAGVFLMLFSCAFMASLLCSLAGSQTSVALLWQILFLIISAGVFISVLELIATYDEFDSRYALIIGGAYIVAWLIGLVTPGAPAGVGIREMILLLILKGVVVEESLLMAVLLGRLVTVAGDLLFFVSAVFIPCKLCVVEREHA